MKKKALLMLPLLTLSFSLVSCGESSSGYEIEEVDNAGGSAYYEIFVSSFADSNGDGIGDLKGIENKLDYLKDLGISHIWLTPIHSSPSYHKYDVKDYYSIDPSFGTMDDFESLVSSAKSKGIGIIMDMVFNHCSNKGTWYQNWVNAVNSKDTSSPYYDDFSWSRSAKDGYAYDSSVGVYVESNFSGDMPEFNLDSEHVREEHKAIQEFWLNKGVEGFRYDAVLYYYCVNVGGVISGIDDSNIPYLKMLHDHVVSIKEDAYTVGECWVSDSSKIASYSSSGMDMFYFPASGAPSTSSIAIAGVPLNSGASFAKGVAAHQAALKEAGGEATPTYFVSNHDQDRWGGYRNGRANAQNERKVMESAYLLTPGTPFLYYGEEIEMLGSRGAKENTDAKRRQAMVWGGGEAICNQPEGVEAEEQVTKGVAECLKEGYSFINHIKKTLSIRNKYKDLFAEGTFSHLDLDEASLVSFVIQLGEKNYFLLTNGSNSSLDLDLGKQATLLEEIPTLGVKASLNSSKLTLPGYSTVLLEA